MRGLLLFSIVLLIVTYPMPELKTNLGDMTLPLYIPPLYLLYFIALLRFFLLKSISPIPTITKASIGLLATTVFSCMLSLLRDGFDWELTLKFLTYLFLPVLFLGTVRDESMLKKLTLLFMFINLVLLIYGYYGFVTWETGERTEHLLNYWGVRYTTATRNDDVLFPLTLSLLLLAYLLFKKSGVLKKAPVVCLLIPSLGALILTQSRSGWVAASAGFLTLLLFYIRQPKPVKVSRSIFCFYGVIVFAGILFGLLHLLLPLGWTEPLSKRALTFVRFSPDVGLSNFERMLLFKDTLLIALFNPLGVGWGNLGQYIQAYGSRSIQHLSHTENMFLNVMVESGWFGFICFSALLFYPIHRIGRILKNDPEFLKWWSVGLYSLLVSFATHGLFNYNIQTIFFWVVVALGTAVLRVLPRPALRLHAPQRFLQ